MGWNSSISTIRLRFRFWNGDVIHGLAQELRPTLTPQAPDKEYKGLGPPTNTQHRKAQENRKDVESKRRSRVAINVVQNKEDKWKTMCHFRKKKPKLARKSVSENISIISQGITTQTRRGLANGMNFLQSRSKIGENKRDRPRYRY